MPDPDSTFIFHWRDVQFINYQLCVNLKGTQFCNIREEVCEMFPSILKGNHQEIKLLPNWDHSTDGEVNKSTKFLETLIR